MQVTEKLRVLLPHWLQHNEGHAKEFADWAAQVSADDPSLAEFLDQAVQALGKAQKALEEALDHLGGPLEDGHDHHHHHHH